MKPIRLKRVQITSGFWKNRIDLLSSEIIPYQWDTLNNRTNGVPPSYAVENFKIAAGESQGVPNGTIFQDSDVAKWIEAASYSLISHPDPKLEEIIDELVRLIGRSQHKNGYVNTFFTAKGIDQRWTDLVMGHELYCAGHLIEAAVAYFRATGKKEFLEIMSRYADLIDREFGPEDGKLHSYDGHPEIELALYRLAEATGRDGYRDLADYFVNTRGSIENYHVADAAKDGMIPKSRWFESDYYLAHENVRGMREVTGHSVRAMYLYSGMADQFLRTRDPDLIAALHALWENLAQRKLYITGGIGSQSHGERFTVDYDLPSDRGYTETCASVGLIFWAWRMTQIEAKSVYADITERALYNGALSGISLDGKSYFYVNPLEVKPRITKSRYDLAHVETNRKGWFDCACCPTNIARLIGSVGQYTCSFGDGEIYLHQFVSSRLEFPEQTNLPDIEVSTAYPWDGRITVHVPRSSSVLRRMYLRKPDWCTQFSVRINAERIPAPDIRDGYIVLERQWLAGDTIELVLDMVPRFVRAHSNVHEQVGKIAIAYGPLLYCVEEFDNGPELQELIIDTEKKAVVQANTLEPSPGVSLRLSGYRERSLDTELYSSGIRPYREPVEISAIPYFQWGNRGVDGEMRVWLRAI